MVQAVCGKTSIVRAGIIPRLADSVSVIYVEATSRGTERAILDAIRDIVPLPSIETIDPSDQLPAAIATLRRHGKKKVVICIDQLEQWLFAHSASLEQESLTRAIRQCDGIHVQCLLMVRDDFWMGITRLMQAIDHNISENHNASSVDLFDDKHAKKVLTLFGQAYGKLPMDSSRISPKQSAFLSSAVKNLSADGRVISVQVALLAEMMRNRDWNGGEVLFDPQGGGLGVHFLEQTFDSDQSSKRFRRHADGAQRVLRSLLPEGSIKIKGAVRSEQFLFEASNYRDKVAFQELIAILDNELHLITPSDGSDTDSLSNSGLISSELETGYQLTHDFLIAPVRKWSELRDLSTRLGQAQARLEEHTELYRIRPIKNSLPTLPQFAMILSQISPSDWTEQQRRMMEASGAYHLKRVATVLGIGLLVLLAGGLGWNWVNRTHEQRIAKIEIERLLDAAWKNRYFKRKS